MLDLLFRLFLTAGFLAVAVWQVKQIREICLFHRISIVHYLIQIGILILFFGMAYVLGETPLDYVFFLMPALSLVLSSYNKGMNHKVVYPYIQGRPLNVMVGNAIPIKDTKDWLILERKNKFKIRFTVQRKEKLPTVYYVDFNKEKQEAIENILLENKISVDRHE